MKQTQQLSLGQKYKIEVLLTIGMSQKDIAKHIGVHKSTVSRELSRNTPRGTKQQRKTYRADFADYLACKRQQMRGYYTKRTYPVERRMIWLLRRGRSPEQISNTCQQRGITMLSHEGIYLWIYEQKRNGKDYCGYLRRGHRSRRKRKNKQRSRPIIKDKTSIDKRPEVVDQQKRVGDMEIRPGKGCLLTATDRKTLFNLGGNFLINQPIRLGKP